MQTVAERGKQRQRQHPQVRRGGQNAARELLADRADDGVRLDVGLPQERENTLPAGQFEQTREHSRADAHGVEAALGHIVAGQVVVGAKVKGRAEPRSVVPHEPGSDQHHRQQERGGLPCPGAAAQPLLPDVPRPEDGHGQKRKQLHLGAAPGDERHAEAAEDELDDQRTALFHRRAGSGEPEPKPQHQQRRTAEDGIFINVGAQQQIVELTAQRYGGHGQQVRCGGRLREPPAHGLPDDAEAGGEEDQPQQDHAGRIGQVLDAGQCLKRQLEQKTRYNAKIDVVAPIVKGVVPVDVVDLHGVARPGIVGVVQRQQLGGRVGLQVKAPVQQAVRQRAVLLVDEADRALPVPERGVVIFCGKAGVARLPERDDHDESSQHKAQHGGCGAVTDVARQPAAVPQPAGRAQAVDGQQRQKYRAEAQNREIQRARRVGRDAAEGQRHRELRVGGAVPGSGQRQHPDGAGQVQADDLGARGLQPHLPAAEAGQLGVGGVGALNGEDHGAVGVERLGVVADQTVKLQVVDGLVNVEEPQIGAALVERDRADAAPDVDVVVKVIDELKRRVAVGVEVGHIADEHLQPQRRDGQQRDDGL